MYPCSMHLYATLGVAAHSIPAQVASPVQTVWEFLAAGGYVMIPIGICSILVLAFTLERWIALRAGAVCPRDIALAVDSIAAARYAEAAATVAEPRSPAARILRAGLRRRGFSVGEVESALEDQAHKEVEKLQRNVRPLTLIAAVAPLLGLLGTVLGIADSFRRVSQAGMGKPELLAGGINEALTTTIAGLCVAIPSMLLAAYLHGRLRRVMIHTDEVLAPAVEFLARRPEIEGSHAA